MKREENQTVEYKESWHEKYLEWICGHANAKGGMLYIGIEDGTKKPVGVKNANKLMWTYEDYEKLSVNLGKRMPVLESESDYFRVTLPNLLYGFTDEQLVAAVDNSSYGVPKSETQSLATHHNTCHDAPPVTPPVTPPVDEKQKRRLQALKDTKLGTSELLKALHIRDRNYFREGYIRPTLRAGLIEQTVPEVKHSRLQKYWLTDKGRAALSASAHQL